MPKRRPHRPQSRLSVRESADGVEVSWPWFTGFIPPYLVALALYAAGLGVGYAAVEAVREGRVAEDWRRPVLGLVSAGAVFSTWVTAALFVNRTTIRVGGGLLTVAHGPLPWPGGRRFRAADVTDVSAAEDVDATGDGDPVVTWRLYVYTRSTYPRTLVAGIEDRQEADRLADLLLAALRRAEGHSG